MVQPLIGQMEISAVGNQLRIQICLHLYLYARLKHWLQQGFQFRYAFRLPMNTVSWSPCLSEEAKPWAKLPATRRPIT